MMLAQNRVRDDRPDYNQAKINQCGGKYIKMREPSLHRMVHYVRKNFIHSYRRPIKSASSRLLHIQASNVKGSDTTEKGIQRPTTIQASILERSPDRQRLYKLIKSLSDRGDGVQWYFMRSRMELVLRDLQAEEQKVRVSILTPGDLLSPPKIIKFSAIDREAIMEHGYVQALLWQIEDYKEQEKYRDMTQLVRIAGDQDHYPLRILFIGTKNFKGETTPPLDPILHRGPRPQLYPVHRALVVCDNPDNIKKELEIDDGEEELVGFILDVPLEVIDRVPANQDAQFRFSSECITLALELARETAPDLDRIEKLWAKSRLRDLVPWIQKLAKKQVSGADSLPAHVRDSIAALLATNIPDALSSFEAFSESQRAELSRSIRNLANSGGKDLKIQLETLQLPPIRLFTLRSKLQKILSETEAATLARAESEFEHAYAVITNKQPDSGPSNHNLPQFSDLRYKIFQLGTSLDSHVRASRRDFFASCGLGAGATGLLIATGIDPVVGLAIFAVMVEVSRRKFVSEIRTLWKTYQDTWAQLGIDCLKNTSDYILGHVTANEAEDLKVYNEKKIALEETKAELKEARELLLKLEPSLKSRYPEWRKLVKSKSKPVEP